MNAKRAKVLRKLLKETFPSWPNMSIYNIIKHPRVIQVREVDANGVSSIVNKTIVKIQIVLGECQRRYYKNWKKAT